MQRQKDRTAGRAQDSGQSQKQTGPCTTGTQTARLKFLGPLFLNHLLTVLLSRCPFIVPHGPAFVSPGCALSEWGPVGHRSVIDPHVGSVLGTLPGQGPLDMTILMTRQDTSRHTVCRFLVQGQQEDTRTGNLKSSHPMCFLLVCCQARLLTRITSVWGPVHVLETVENGDLGFSILKITIICVCLLSRRCAVG